MNRKAAMKFPARSFGVKAIAFSTFAACALTAVSCSNTDPKLEPYKKPEQVEKVISKVNPLGALPKLDVLFVVDDSGSMGVHQTNLSTNIDLFVNTFFSGALLDYHIGVITTSVGSSYSNGDGQLVGTPNFIDRNTPNGLQKLKTNLLVGTSGSGTEQLFEPLRLALSTNAKTINKDFYRDDALLAVVFITDAEEQGTMSPQTAYDFLVQTLKGGHKEAVSVTAVIVPSDDTNNCPRDEPGFPPYSPPGYPVRTEEFVKLAGGTSFSLCDPAYGQKLAAIGKDLFQKVLKVLHLTRAPIVETITVKFGTQTIPQDSKVGWVYDPATVSLIFGDDIKWTSQPSGTQLDINFDPIDFDNIQPQTKKPQPN